MNEGDFEGLADFVSDVIVKDKDVKDKVKDFRQRFLEMKYCLPSDQAIPLAARILSSISADPRFVDRFLKSLERYL